MISLRQAKRKARSVAMHLPSPHRAAVREAASSVLSPKTSNATSHLALWFSFQERPAAAQPAESLVEEAASAPRRRGKVRSAVDAVKSAAWGFEFRFRL